MFYVSKSMSLLSAVQKDHDCVNVGILKKTRRQLQGCKQEPTLITLTNLIQKTILKGKRKGTFSGRDQRKLLLFLCETKSI